MSGAVQTVAKVASKAFEVANLPEKALHRSITSSDFIQDSKFLRGTVGANRSGLQLAQEGTGAIGNGKGFDGAVKATVGKSAEGVKVNMGNIKGAVSGDPAAPQTIVAEDPATVAAEAEKKKARAKRQAEIDILTNKPGRGGTVLTDQYTYNV